MTVALLCMVQSAGAQRPRAGQAVTAVADSQHAVSIPVPVAATPAPQQIVLASFAGGIAKGAYQGGVDYVISEFLRRQRDTTFRKRLESLVPDQRRTLPDFRLGAVTGASAGNINALLASVSWCTAAVRDSGQSLLRSLIAPEQSLFWSIWVNTGFSEMLPATSRSGEARELAVLDRYYFDVVQKGNVRQFLDRAQPLRGCDVPLGVTLTKLTPVEVSLIDGRGSASVQRFATVLNVRTMVRGHSSPWIDFQEPSRAIQSSSSLGALALLPQLASTAHATGPARLDALFDVVLASSSFPVAFAPKQICYMPGGLAASPGSTETTCARFNDGGLFDNNPFGLALRLFELNVPSDSVMPSVVVAYSNPNRYRGALNIARRPEAAKRDRDGLAGVMQMLSGAWSAAAEYELQSLARQVQRDRELARLDSEAVRPARRIADAKMLLSSRSAPIMGEQLSSFGAFLGRAFREYDFYVGVYDGLEFVSRHFICADSARDDAAHASVKESCTEAAHAAFVDQNVFDLGDVAKSVVGWQRSLEYGGRPPATVQVPAPPAPGEGPPTEAQHTAWRRTMLTGIHNAMLPLRHRPYEVKCTRRNDPVAARLCPTGLDVVLQSLADDTLVVSAAKYLATACDSARRERGECTADPTFVELLRSPRRHVHLLVERALTNLENAEDSIQAAPGDLPEYSAFVEAAFAQYRAAAFRYRTGIGGSRIEINPSTARWDASRISRTLGSLVGVLAPNYLSLIGAGRSDDWPSAAGVNQIRSTSPVWGWRPVVLRADERMYLASAAELSWYRDATVSGQRQHEFAFGASAGTHVWTPPGFSSLEIGAIWTHHVLHEESKPVTDRFPILNVTGRLLSEKLYLNVRGRTDHAWAVSAGFSDLNGLLYWWLR